MLRYVCVAAVLARRAGSIGTAATPVSARVRHALREAVKLVQLEEYQYSDPVTEFLRELYVEFDFERAQKALAAAEGVVADDFFLGDFRDEFMDNARYLITEAYCRIHQRIDIGYVGCHIDTSHVLMSYILPSDLSERLNLSRDEGEKWIVNLIRETRMGADAKIDLEKVRPHKFSNLPKHANAGCRMSSRSPVRLSRSTKPSSRRPVDSPSAPRRWVLPSSARGLLHQLAHRKAPLR